MFDLPDNLWRTTLEIGISNTILTYKDLCSISITCKRLHRLSGEDSLWSHLLFFDFPGSYSWIYYLDSIHRVSLNEIADKPSSSSAKSDYKIMLERKRRLEAWAKAHPEILGEPWLQRLVPKYELDMQFPQLYFQIRAADEDEDEDEDEEEEEEENIFDILSAKIREIELAKEFIQLNNGQIENIYDFEPAVPDRLCTRSCDWCFQANSNGFKRLQDRPFPREKRSKCFTRHRKTWHR